MILFVIVMNLCLDYALLFPLPTCNAGSKTIYYIFHCECEFNEQVKFMEKAKQYFEHHTKVSIFDVKLYAGNESFWSFERPDSLSEKDCKKSLPIFDVMQLSNQWEIYSQNTYFDCSFYSSIIFIHNISVEDETFMNETIENELKSNIRNNRFFIIKSSEKNFPMDYFYYTPSFGDLKIEDVFPYICNFDNEDYVFTYSGGTYLNSKYFIAKQLLSLDAEEVSCYCESRYGSDVISFETFDEMLYIFEIIMNLFSKNSKHIHEINLHINLKFDTNNLLRWKFNKPYVFFIPSTYMNWTECFYLQLAITRNFRLHAEGVYSSGSFLEQTGCHLKLLNTLTVCEDNDVNDVINTTHSFSADQLNKGTANMMIVDKKLLTKFIENIFHHLNDTQISSDFTYGHCIVKTKGARNLIETYLCGNDYINAVVNVSNADMNMSINLLTKQHDYFFTYKTVGISKCDMYNECQAKVKNETVDINTNTDVTIYCSGERELHQDANQCSAQVISLNLNLEYFQCKTNEDQHFYKCIKDPNRHCSDNSNLLNCENFSCPEPFFKCFNSYCVFPFMIDNVLYDCPLGDDENSAGDESSSNCEIKNQNFLWSDISFALRDICIDSKIFAELQALMKESNFLCQNICPQNYKCVSSRTERNVGNNSDTEVIVSYYRMTLREIIRFVPFISLVGLYGFYIGNFDQVFQNLSFNDIIILDLGNNHNNLTHSNNFKSIENYNKLKYLNLSYNVELVIDHDFMFPRLLEIIDLSYTNIASLKRDNFYSLTYLRHLNISFTLINTFKGMGIPNNFKLDTLFIEGFLTKYLEIDLFRGLAIELELRASDYVMCCPQVLNPNIDVDKCIAPVDIISTCKHLVGDTFKRIVIWIVGIVTVVGNGSVLIYRIGWNREIFKKAYGLYVTGLAVSDLLMGVYLISIAIGDAHYNDVYVLNDFAWRNSFLCQILGMLSTLSSEASSFFICLITLDRFLNISYPFGEHRFSKTSIQLLFTLVWLVSFVLAVFPVLASDWEIYSSNGLCLALPFSSTKYKGWIFSFVIFVVLNFVLCLLIVVGQLAIFINLIKANKSNAIVGQNNQRKSQEKTVAQKLAFVAMTDFCCWFPVGILGILSLYGHIFNREVYAWIAVFVLPINSALNPIIYTLPALYSLCKSYI